LDLHALPGWQGPDWHCDNASRHALFWQHRDFQDRVVALWEELARRYRGNPAVAAYDLINEPVSGQGNNYTSGLAPSDWGLLNRVYRRLVQAIRTIDPEHIIVLEGDYFAASHARPEAAHAGAAWGPAGRYAASSGGMGQPSESATARSSSASSTCTI
jgi:aryl-phospho-beta-D-glucosidase BglC (GH1 family)